LKDDIAYRDFFPDRATISEKDDFTSLESINSSKSMIVPALMGIERRSILLPDRSVSFGFMPQSA
jgi:hypothetical protein